MRKKKARSSFAAEKVAGNTYMLSDILLRVPLKTLIRLKCVSKQWRLLISDEQFRDSHSLHHQRYPNSLIFSSDLDKGPSYILSLTTKTATATATPRVLKLDFLNQFKLIVIRSCKGLLLCRRYNSSYIYFICNPITRHFTTLNLCRHPFMSKTKNFHLYLAFDPSISPRYKVVSLAASLNSPGNWVFHVYTFKTRSRIGPGVSVSIPFELEEAAKGVYCNGAIHWYNRGQFSVYFDVDTQRLKNYPMPLLSASRYSGTYYFGEMGGRLHCMLPFTETKSYLDNQYGIFELKEDYSGWLFRHRIDLNPIRVEFPHITWQRRDLSFYIFGTPKDENKKKKSSMSVLIVGNEGAIFHDPVDKTSRKLCDFDFKMGAATYFQIQNSLVCRRRIPLHQHFENLC